MTRIFPGAHGHSQRPKLIVKQICAGKYKYF
jgi:hypothetical protein